MVALGAVDLLDIIVVDKTVRLPAIAAGVFFICLVDGSVGFNGIDLHIGTY